MKKVISLILVIAIILLVGCADVTEADTQTYYIQDDEHSAYEPYQIVVDKETGVNYIVYCGNKKGGIIVRINADGTPYVSGVNGNE